MKLVLSEDKLVWPFIDKLSVVILLITVEDTWHSIFWKYVYYLCRYL